LPLWQEYASSDRAAELPVPVDDMFDKIKAGTAMLPGFLLI
jgi:hypothetical protein